VTPLSGDQFAKGTQHAGARVGEERAPASEKVLSIAYTLADQVEQARIMTPDRDLGQAVRGDQVVQFDRLRERTYDEEGVLDRLGVPRERFLAWCEATGVDILRARPVRWS
jgi:hypothetical protein